MPISTNSKTQKTKELTPQKNFFKKLIGTKKTAVAKSAKTKLKTPQKTVAAKTSASLKKTTAVGLKKTDKNPIITPKKENKWESQQTFNSAAVLENGKVHLLYRALGDDGVSRIGYAISENGIDIEERLERPIFTYHNGLKARDSLNMPEWYQHYNSGGGWNGCEDPRITKIDEKIYMCFVAFDECNEPAIAITNIKLDDFLKRKWKWSGVKIRLGASTICTIFIYYLLLFNS